MSIQSGDGRRCQTGWHIPVGADGEASVTWTPDNPGDYGLFVYSETADGQPYIPR